MLQPVQALQERRCRWSDQLGEREMEHFQAVIGRLSWLSTQSRPDIIFSVYELFKLGKLKKKSVDDLLRANRVVIRVQDNKYAINFSTLSLSSLDVECFSDASYDNPHGGSSQRSYLIFLTDHQGRRVIVSWQHYRQRTLHQGEASHNNCK